jgi:hypothetical protein
MLAALKVAISRRLCPEAHKDAERYQRVMRHVEDGRWWLGAQHPEAASFAQLLYDREQYDRTGELPMRRPEWTWQAPAALFSISQYRDWLARKPFAARTANPSKSPEA